MKILQKDWISSTELSITIKIDENTIVHGILDTESSDGVPYIETEDKEEQNA